MKIILIIAFIIAVVGGLFLVNPWVFLYYLVFLGVVSILVLFIVFNSLLDKNKMWKKALLWLAVGYTAVLSAYCIRSYMSSRISHMRDRVIVALYDYRQKNKQFPQNAEELSFDLSPFRGRYIPDSGLNNFKLYTKDLYGMPWVFSSVDSTWGR